MFFEFKRATEKIAAKNNTIVAIPMSFSISNIFIIGLKYKIYNSHWLIILIFKKYRRI